MKCSTQRPRIADNRPRKGLMTADAMLVELGEAVLPEPEGVLCPDPVPVVTSVVAVEVSVCPLDNAGEDPFRPEAVAEDSKVDVAFAPVRILTTPVPEYMSDEDRFTLLSKGST